MSKRLELSQHLTERYCYYLTKTIKDIGWDDINLSDIARDNSYPDQISTLLLNSDIRQEMFINDFFRGEIYGLREEHARRVNQNLLTIHESVHTDLSDKLERMIDPDVYPVYLISENYHLSIAFLIRLIGFQRDLFPHWDKVDCKDRHRFTTELKQEIAHYFARTGLTNELTGIITNEYIGEIDFSKRKYAVIKKDNKFHPEYFKYKDGIAGFFDALTMVPYLVYYNDYPIVNRDSILQFFTYHNCVLSVPGKLKTTNQIIPHYIMKRIRECQGKYSLAVSFEQVRKATRNVLNNLDNEILQKLQNYKISIKAKKKQ
jgi:hypothetical protein